MQDVDECSKPGACAPPGRCRNAPGSFSCSCPDGYRTSPDGRGCDDVNECLGGGLCAGGFCRNVPGGAVCECPEGWQLEEVEGAPEGAGRCVDLREERCYEEYRARYGLLFAQFFLIKNRQNAVG